MRKLSLAFLLACSLVGPAAFAQKVNIDFDKQADFSHIRRYQWRLHPMYEKDPSLKEKFSVAIQLVAQSGNKELMKRGFQPVESNPDVFLTFFIMADDAQKTTTTYDSLAVGPTIGPWWGSPYGWYGADMPVWTTTTVENFIEGALVLDVVDAKTSKLLWRAYARDEIHDMSQRAKNIDSAVRKALNKFPPKKK